MYPAFFGLLRRPFSPVPNAACLAQVDSAEAAYSTLLDCLELGRGIAVLTAPAGLGKTLLCRRLAAALQQRFAVAFLATAPAPTRRALLQTILYELGHQNVRAGEGELRMRLAKSVRQLPSERAGLVLILDEAHLIPERLLEEARALTSLSIEGEPLVRLLLSGQLSLEEKLASPRLADLGQRIGCHCTLAALTQEESRNYLTARVDWAGGHVCEVFTPEALRLIAHASDGSPRALNQLGEECLLIAARRQERPARESTVLEALRELQQLPLHWNVSFAADAEWRDRSEQNVGAADVDALSSIEFGGDDESLDRDVFREENEAVELGFEDVPSENASEPIQLASTQPAVPANASLSDDAPRIERPQSVVAPVAADPALPCGCGAWNSCLCEDHLDLNTDQERLIDRYALLDAGLPAPEPRRPALRPPVGPDGVLPELADLRDEERRIPILAQASIQVPVSVEDQAAVVATTGSAASANRPPQPVDRVPMHLPANEDPSDDVEMRIGSTVLETCMAAQRAIRRRIEAIDLSRESADDGTPAAEAPQRPRRDRSAEIPNGLPGPAADSHRSNGCGPGIRRDDPQSHEPRLPRRRFERLFSELRRRSREA